MFRGLPDGGRGATGGDAARPGRPGARAAAGYNRAMPTPLRPPLLLLLICCLPLAAAAQTVYRYVDEKGVTHYTDRKPAEATEVRTIRVRAEQQPLAGLRIEGNGAERRAVASNRTAGPLEVELSFQGAVNAAAEPPLPARVVLPADGERALAALRPLDPHADASFSVALEAVPGDPAGRHDDPVYRLPLAAGNWRIDQGFDGAFSHTEPASRHAIDIAVDEGTPVLAAREGVVMQVERHFEGAGLDREKFGGRANHVRVVHADGSMAVYAHLQADSVLVRPGARVRVGQHPGNSGNTGYSTGPHLHFVVQLNRGMRLESVPFRMEGPGGPVRIPGAK
jgi:murein DD-endopeptidase MepM/ murein hydrolase activator NlpD